MNFMSRGAVKFSRYGHSSSHTGNYAKEKPQSNSISDTEYDRVCYRSGEQPQRPMFAAQKIVCKIQRAEHVQACSRNAHAGQQMMIDGMREMHAMIVEGSCCNFKASFLAYLFF